MRINLRQILSTCLLFFVLLAVSGCSTYDERMKEITDLYFEGKLTEALIKMELMTKEAEVSDEGVYRLFLMEKSMIHSRMGNYQLATKDLMRAYNKNQVEVLTNNPKAMAKYLFTDYAGLYRTKPYEEVVHNTINMINFMAMGDLSGAAVEAKQFHNAQYYWEKLKDETGAGNALGYYLGYLVLKKLERYGEFPNFERDAKRYSKLPASYYEVLEPTNTEMADLVVVIESGRVPYRVKGQRALTSREFAGRMAKYRGSWLRPQVKFPKLVSRKATHRGLSGISVDGINMSGTCLLNIGSQAISRYKKDSPLIITAALTRTLTRAIAAYAAAEVAKSSWEDHLKNQKRQRGQGAYLNRQELHEARQMGQLAGSITEASMLAADTPDTRCWSLLPNRVYVHKSKVTPGSHVIEIKLKNGETISKRIDVNAGGLKTVLFVLPWGML